MDSKLQIPTHLRIYRHTYSIAICYKGLLVCAKFEVESLRPLYSYSEFITVHYVILYYTVCVQFIPYEDNTRVHFIYSTNV